MAEFIPYRREKRPAEAAVQAIRVRLSLGTEPPRLVELRELPALVGSAATCGVRLPDYVSPPVLGVLFQSGGRLRVRQLVEEPKLAKVGGGDSQELGSGDLLRAGPCSLLFEIPGGLAGDPAASPPSLPAPSPPAGTSFDDERRDWEEDAQRQAEALAARSRQVLEREKELGKKEEALAERQACLAANELALSQRAEELRLEEQKVQAARAETEQLRLELGQLRDSVVEQLRQRREQLRAREAELERTAAELRDAAAKAAAQPVPPEPTAQTQLKLVEEWQAELDAEHRDRLAKLEEREARLAEGEQRLAAKELALRELALQLEQRREEVVAQASSREQTTNAQPTPAEEAATLPFPVPAAKTLSEDDLALLRLLRGAKLLDGPLMKQVARLARQHQLSIREVLLKEGMLTPFQLSRLEAGRVAELSLGAVRLLDELRFGPVEAFYRVFDLDRQREALLRRLLPGQSAARVAEYREQFQAATKLRHEHVASTLAVLETPQGPAVLQEWPEGVESEEWADLAAPPRVWLRLLRQATRGLAAMHAQRLLHGRLHAGRLLLTQEGSLKICGLGEPGWLHGEAASRPASVSDDLRALARIAFQWLRAGSGASDPSLLALLKRYDDPQIRAAVLVELIDAVARQLSGDESDWQRLLRFVRGRLEPTPEAARQAA